ncbi:hypothetical protein M2322_004396 [Rhodoblastus acidophilus]|uniref:hypothetical protein n=1 Tax=Rhodoblastus acidophilus TaxID=1074 RepID=UPI0022245DBC|nr:hypothetical protein [Rhodoblastus acidophilus]MCW2318827.1 hypothetical protein [Rhodoblastus acidophilus]
MTAPVAHAQAPSDEIILDYLKSIFTSIDVIDYKRVYEGALESLKDVVVIRYSLDYPTGGSEAPPKTSELEVLTIEDDRIKNIPVMPLPVGQVDDVSVRDGQIHVEILHQDPEVERWMEEVGFLLPPGHRFPDTETDYA